MRRMIIPMLLLMAALPLAGAVSDTHTITLQTVIPEDWAVVFPHALHIDNLFFAEDDIGENYKLISHSDVDAGVTSEDGESMRVVLLYYGNPAEKYSIELSVNSDSGFVSEDVKDEEHQFPVTISFEEPEIKPDDVFINISEDKTRAAVEIEPTGPISGLRVLDMVFSWDGEKILRPGNYKADIELSMVTR